MKSIYEFGDEDKSKEGRAIGAVKNVRLWLPIIKVLYELGINNFFRNSEISNLLKKKINLGDQDLQPHNNETEFDYRIKWALNRLKNGGFAVKNPSKQKSWKISEKGVAFLNKYGLQLTDKIHSDEIEKARREISENDLSRQTKYWAVGFGSGDGNWYTRLDKFKTENYWQALDYDKSDNSKVANEARKLFNQIELDDLVLIKGFGGKSDLVVHYVGKVIDIDTDSNKIEFEPIDVPLYKGKAPNEKGAGNWFKTILEIKREKDIKLLFKTEEENVVMEDEPLQNVIYDGPKNIILYGPPGTGKTYCTKELAVRIVNPNFKIDENLSDKEKRNAILDQYKILHQSEQIVFNTFHQSYSYEDFVEGIKPETIDGEINYATLPGLFKELCEKANIKSGSNFEEVLSQFKRELITKDKISINTGTIEFDVFYKGGKTFRINPKGSRNENPRYPASIENILKLYQNVSDEGMYNPSYVTGILNYLYQNYALKKYDSLEDRNEKNYVLIIDEINRGNISAIFGELITLLEKDKRLGEKEEIKVKLPYSKTEFGIPSNVFIIGTMNTADRSVEALDTALRRRFVFKEIMPNPDLLKDHLFEGFNLKMVLETINNRIEALLDRDHAIGHSYFLGVDNLEKLSEVFKNCIIPLLQEYFYGDYEKIAMIIGSGFVEKYPKANVIFSNYENYTFSNMPNIESKFVLKEEVTDVVAAVKLLLNI